MVNGRMSGNRRSTRQASRSLIKDLTLRTGLERGQQRITTGGIFTKHFELGSSRVDLIHTVLFESLSVSCPPTKHPDKHGDRLRGQIERHRKRWSRVNSRMWDGRRNGFWKICPKHPISIFNRSSKFGWRNGRKVGSYVWAMPRTPRHH